jgi:hypothetical protein
MPRSKRSVAGRPERDPFERWLPGFPGYDGISFIHGLEGAQKEFHDLVVRIAMATSPEPPEIRKAIIDARNRLAAQSEQACADALTLLQAAIEVLTPNKDRQTAKAQANSAYSRSTPIFWRVLWILEHMKLDPHDNSTPGKVEKRMYEMWKETRKARLRGQSEFEAVAALEWVQPVTVESMSMLQADVYPSSETAIRNALKRWP